ncbi:anti-sigma factor [Amycolatopsis nalaikhensis]|uniref:Regulator of SigK n=1 Tax=Amycolatopsis nalaikhensis TaxID=715472 RepID=A0ABY8Y317_9PSEU|nr:anti-sigma factor [Amycolatopsis sp. 2-2]WIV62176.1 anti-sigma factor [Amycolatopsis sp. 2-2]
MHTLAGAFALDAVNDVERAEFARHLEQCESCAQEVAELRATAARLGAAMAEEPPPEFKDRVLAAMHATRQLPPRTRPGSPERHRRTARAPRWAVIVSAAAAVVGLAAGGVFGGIALTQQQELNAAQSRLDQARQRYEPVAALLAAPDAKAAHGEAPTGGGVTVVLSRTLNRVMVMDAGLPAQPGGKVYEAWLVTGSAAPRSAGVIAGTGNGALVIADGVGTADHVAVSVEPAGGSPTGAPSDVLMSMPVPA